MTDASSEGVVFDVPDGSQGTCSSFLGRDCEANSLESSGDLPSREDEGPLSALSEHTSSLVVPIAVGEVQSTVENNYGIGRL